MAKEKEENKEKKAELERPYVWEPRKRKKAGIVASGVAESKVRRWQGNH